MAPPSKSDGEPKKTTGRRIIKKSGQEPTPSKPAKRVIKKKAPPKKALSKKTAPKKTAKPPQPPPPAAKQEEEPSPFDMSLVELEGAMTDKQLLFCLEFLKDFNATQAAIRAKYSKATARQMGTENLSKPVIQAYLSKRKAVVIQESKLSVNRVVDQIAKLGFSDIRQLFNENGQLTDITELGDDIATAVQSVEIERRTEGKGDDQEVYYVHKIRLADKKGPLDMLAKYLDMYRKADEGDEAEKAKRQHEETATALGDLIKSAKAKAKEG